MNINYEYYRIFYYAAKYKNLTLAAEAIHNNQPNISRTIKLLEHELGCTLLIRSNRGITLTPEGERLYSHIKTAVEQIQAAEEEILLSRGLQKGIVTIAATETALHLLLFPILKDFRKSYPGIHIRILNHLAGQAMESVKNGLVDFALIATHTAVEKPLVSHPILEFRDILIGGPSYAFLKNTGVSLNELLSHPLIGLGEASMTYQFYTSFFLKNGLSLKFDLEAATTDLLLPMIKNDLGIGFIPEVFAKDALKKGEIFQIPLAAKIPSRHICFIENENHPLSVASRELKKLLMQN